MFDATNTQPRLLRRARDLLVVLVLFGAIGWLYFSERARRDSEWRQEWGRKQKELPSSGGKFFKERIVIDVPAFLQNDERWGNNSLGPSITDTLGSHGCAVASTAMVLACYGVDTDPRRLNDFLSANEGYTPEAWLKWEVAAQLSPERVKFVYEDDPSYQLIDENLERRNPVIIRLRYPPPGSITHFVVVCGKEGYDYLIVDPGSRASRGVYPLKELTPTIEALRFYEIIPPAAR